MGFCLLGKIIFFSKCIMSDFVEEASSNLSTGNLPIYYKYRYTFPSNADWSDLHDRINRFKNIFNFIKSRYSIGNIVGGMEEYTKGMVSTKPHIHIHFMSKHNSDTIRKALMREFEMIGRCQCCKAEVIINDVNKFFRYPLKQQKNETKKYYLYSGFSQQEIEVMIDIAYECWRQCAEIAVHKIEKKLEKTARDRLFCYLDNLPFVFKNIKQSYCIAYQYFVENEETLCLKTVNAYMNIYLAKNKHITYEELYDFQFD